MVQVSGLFRIVLTLLAGVSSPRGVSSNSGTSSTYSGIRLPSLS